MSQQDVSISWQWVATTVVGLLTSLLFYLIQDTRSDIRALKVSFDLETKEIRSVVDKNSWIVSYVQGLQSAAETRIVQTEGLKNQLNYYADRQATIIKRLLSISQRQDRCKCPASPDGSNVDIDNQSYQGGSGSYGRVVPDTLLNKAKPSVRCNGVDSMILYDVIEQDSLIYNPKFSYTP